MPVSPSSESVDILDTLHELVYLLRTGMRRTVEATHPQLSFNDMRILIHVGRRPGMAQRDLVEHSHVDKAQMARALNQLQERGWLTRSPDASDRRVRCLYLSETGQQIYVQLRTLREQQAEQVLQGCSAEERVQLLGWLQQFRDRAAMDD